MPETEPLSALQVIGIRYRGVQFADNDERALDAYIASGIYDAIEVSVGITEPQFPGHPMLEDDPQNPYHAREADFGLFNGLIAEQVATARRAGKAVLMTGGDCVHITGVVGGLQDVHGPDARIGLVWFDAHGDFNTPYTTLTGSMGGMPVAVCAGLAFPTWRESAHIAAPLPADRIAMVDVRNLDPAEEQLIRSAGILIAAPAAGFSGDDLTAVITDLASRCDLLYLHIDSDILDESYVPNHSTVEPDGPDMAQVLAAVDVVMATGKVAAYAVVSVYASGEGRERSVQSGIELIGGGLAAWKRHGMAAIGD